MTPRKGDKVRVTFEGTIFDRKGNETYVDPGPDRLLFRLPPNATVEVIEDLRPGDVYRDAEQSVAVYRSPLDRTPWMAVAWKGSPADATLVWWNDKQMIRPLTLLVRDGKPVTE